MTDTPNHGYTTPPEGTENWHVPLNENFEKLDNDVEIRGPEEDKGKYEPEEGTKYEATDSGAVYYGDGTSWVLANREVDSISANNINGVKVPDGTDIDAFRDAVDRAYEETANKGAVVRLRPDVEYQWDETFTYNPADGNLRVEAHHATINHTSDPAVETTSSIGTRSHRLMWFGGVFVGPGQQEGDSVDPQGIPDAAPEVPTGTSTFRLSDSFGHTIKPDACRDVTAGIYVRNVDHWSEALKLGHTRTGGVGSHEWNSLIHFLCLGGPYVGTSAGGSMRNIQIKIDWSMGQADYMHLYQGAAGFQGGKIEHRHSAPKGYGDDEIGWCWFSDGNLEGTHIHFETEFGGNNVKAIEFAGVESDQRGPPPFIFRDPEDRIENSRAANIFYYRRNGGWKSVEGQKGFRIPFNRDRWEWESRTTLEPGSLRLQKTRNIARFGARHREIKFDDGSGGSHPAGYYWFDAEGLVEENHWILMGDTDTTVSPD